MGTGIFFSVAIWKNVATDCEIPVGSANFLVALVTRQAQFRTLSIQCPYCWVYCKTTVSPGIWKAVNYFMKLLSKSHFEKPARKVRTSSMSLEFVLFS